MTKSTDRIEKRIELKAPRARVWKAISDASEFGEWFQIAIDGSLAPGRTVAGRITTPGKYAGLRFELSVERMEPESLFSYRWHPYAIDPKVDYTSEPKTLVELRLEEIPGGTRLTVVESGFDAIPAARRAEAFRMNEGGWAQQLTNVERHVSR
jgi:uncharacterized protein YndB with AHSA1/START domain